MMATAIQVRSSGVCRGFLRRASLSLNLLAFILFPCAALEPRSTFLSSAMAGHTIREPTDVLTEALPSDGLSKRCAPVQKPRTSENVS